MNVSPNSQHRSNRKRLRKPLAVFGSILTLLSTLTVLGATTHAGAAAVNTTITGTAFRDFNANGIMNSDNPVPRQAIDVGVGGVTVEAFDDADTLVGSATTAANGTYSLAYTYDDATSGAVRLEFTPPAPFVEGPAGSGTGIVSKSGVQFAGPGAKADYGVVSPGDYSVADPLLVMAVSASGDVSPDTDSIRSLDYPVGDVGAFATQGQTGNVWGSAIYENRAVLTAQFTKRHTPVGPSGVGAIYLTDMTTGTKNAELFVKIPDPGAEPRVVTDGYNWAQDPNMGFQRVYKSGLGDLDITLDGSSAFVTNLNNRKLYEVPIVESATPGGLPTAGTPIAIDMPLAVPGAATGCALDQIRPMALEISPANVLFAALTCTGPESANLRMYVYSMDLDAGRTWSAAPVIETSLNYRRTETNGTTSTAWLPWEDSAGAFYRLGEPIRNRPGDLNLRMNYPLVSDLTLHSNGEFTIGIKNRTSDLAGTETTHINDPSVRVLASTHGEVLKACANGAGKWIVESNGKCGALTGANPNAGYGKGNGEFFADSRTVEGAVHDDAHNGSTENLPGFQIFPSTKSDPDVTSRTQGVGYLNLQSGGKSYEKVISNLFGKADGIGELSAVLGDAPIQIGNYIWDDADKDGVQDPGERPLAGVTVRLYDAAGVEIASTVTATDGSYYFGTEDGLEPDTEYSIRVDNPADYEPGGPLENYTLTGNDQGGDDETDSDATEVDGFPRITVTTGDLGSNDHSLDVGFFEEDGQLVFRKRVIGTPSVQPDGSTQVRYALTVTNDTQDAIDYDLTDTLRFGGGLTITSATAENTQPGTIVTDPAWDGVAATQVVSDVTLPADETHVYRVTVNAILAATGATATSADCTLDQGEAGTGFLNAATLTTDDVVKNSTACRPAPQLELTKDLVGTPVEIDEDTSEITYDITVNNRGSATAYDLDDALRFAPGIVIDGVVLTNEAPGTIVTNANWDGVADLSIVEDEAIANGGVHRYRVVVTATIPADVALAPAARDCELGDGESGTGFLNVATLTAGEFTLTDDACAPTTSLSFLKRSVGQPVLLPDGNTQVRYELTVTNSGSAAKVYDLTDTPLLGDGLTGMTASVTNTDPGTIDINAAWNGVDEAEIASAVTIDPGDTHVYRVLVAAHLSTTGTTATSADCELGAGETGTGFFNTATVTTTTETIESSACLPAPRVEMTKTLVGTPEAVDADTSRISYDIVVSNLGAVTRYDLDDTLRFAPGVVIDEVSVTSHDAIEVPTNPSWDGVSDLSITSEQTILARDVHTFRVVVTATVPAGITLTDAQADCTLGTGETGTGFLNDATLTSGEFVITDDACAPIETPDPDPGLGLVKSLTSAPALNAAGNYELTYDIVVSNPAAAATVYDLTDALRFGAELDVVSASVANTVPGSITTNASWNGLTDLDVATDVSLAANGSHTYVVTVEANLTANMTAASADCSLGAGESGTGFLNEATVSDGTVTLEDDACAPGPILDIDKVLVGSPAQVDTDTDRVTYEIVVTNTVGVEALYDLEDTLAFANGTTIDAVTVSNTTPGTIATNAAFNGGSDVGVASDVTIASGGRHVYRVIVDVSIADRSVITAQAGDCRLDQSESGTGYFNTAVLHVGSTDLRDTACAPIEPPDPEPTDFDLTINKSLATAGPYVAGMVVEYRLMVTNLGPASTLDGLTVTDRLPVGLTYVAANPAVGDQWTCAAPDGQDITCTWNGPTAGLGNDVLAAGQRAPLVSVFATLDADAPEGSLVNYSVVRPSPDEPKTERIPVGGENDGFEDGDPTSRSNNDDSTPLTPSEPQSLPYDLTISKVLTSAGPFTAGSTATFELRITNLGPGSVFDGIQVTDRLPAGLTFVSAVGSQWSCDAPAGRDVTCTWFGPTTGRDVLVAGASAPPITVTTTIDASAPTGDLVNLAKVVPPTDQPGEETVPPGGNDGFEDGDPTKGSNNDDSDKLRVEDPPAPVPYDLTISKVLTSAGPYTPGATVTFGLRVTNLGPGAASDGLFVTDRLPAGLTFVSATGDQWSCAQVVGGNVVCVWNGPTDGVDMLAAGVSTPSITVTATIDADAAGSLVNDAKVEPNPRDPIETIPPGTDDDGFEDGDPTKGSNNDDSAKLTVPTSVIPDTELPPPPPPVNPPPVTPPPVNPPTVFTPPPLTSNYTPPVVSNGNVPRTPLAYTGTNLTVTLLGWGMLLIAAGGLLLAGSRRNRRRTASTVA